MIGRAKRIKKWKLDEIFLISFSFMSRQKKIVGTNLWYRPLFDEPLVRLSNNRKYKSSVWQDTFCYKSDFVFVFPPSWYNDNSSDGLIGFGDKIGNRFCILSLLEKKQDICVIFKQLDSIITFASSQSNHDFSTKIDFCCLQSNFPQYFFRLADHKTSKEIIKKLLYLEIHIFGWICSCLVSSGSLVRF